MASPDASPMTCPRCGTLWIPEAFAPGRRTVCSTCGVPSTIYPFPAMTRPLPKGSPGEQILTDSEASCFYHAKKRASTVCDACGRFLCALCDIQVRGQHYCAGCLEVAKKKDTLAATKRRTVLYDELALGLAVLPLLLWPATIATAPAALVVVCRYWRTPAGLMPRQRGKSVAAAIIALLEIAGWITALCFALR